MQGVWVWSLVEELRSHTPGGQKTKKHKTEAICNKFNKNLKMIHTKSKEKSLAKNLFKWEKNLCSSLCCLISFCILNLILDYFVLECFFIDVKYM